MEATSGSNIDAYDLVIVDPLRGALRQGGGTDLGRGGLRARHQERAHLSGDGGGEESMTELAARQLELG
jgi:hypothetical protein